MRRWKREWETRQQYKHEMEHEVMFKRMIDYTVIGSSTGAMVMVTHLADITFLAAIALAIITFIFTVVALVFCEKSDEERMEFVIQELTKEGIKTNDQGEEKKTDE